MPSQLDQLTVRIFRDKFQYPEESVAMQQRIINRVESDPHYRNYLDAIVVEPDKTPTGKSK